MIISCARRWATNLNQTQHALLAQHNEESFVSEATNKTNRTQPPRHWETTRRSRNKLQPKTKLKKKTRKKKRTFWNRKGSTATHFLPREKFKRSPKYFPTKSFSCYRANFSVECSEHTHGMALLRRAQKMGQIKRILLFTKAQTSFICFTNSLLWESVFTYI